MSATYIIFGLEPGYEDWVREGLEDEGISLPTITVYGRSPSVKDIVVVLETLQGYDCSWGEYSLDKNQKSWAANARPEDYKLINSENRTEITIHDYDGDEDKPRCYCLRNINSLDALIMQRLSKIVGTLVAFCASGTFLVVTPDMDLMQVLKQRGYKDEFLTSPECLLI